MTRKKKILVFSSVLPKNSGGGEVVLYRHLNALVDWDVVVMCPRVSSEGLEFPQVDLPINTLWDRLRKTPLRRFADSYIHLTGRLCKARTMKLVQSESPDLILTVAHGEFFWPALHYAEELDVPLVSIFHDWYPDMIDVYPWCRSIIKSDL